MGYVYIFFLFYKFVYLNPCTHLYRSYVHSRTIVLYYIKLILSYSNISGIKLKNTNSWLRTQMGRRSTTRWYTRLWMVPFNESLLCTSNTICPWRQQLPLCLGLYYQLFHVSSMIYPPFFFYIISLSSCYIILHFSYTLFSVSTSNIRSSYQHLIYSH